MIPLPGEEERNGGRGTIMVLVGVLIALYIVGLIVIAGVR